MKRLIYIGNFLSKNKTYLTASDLLVSTLLNSGFEIEKASSHRNKLKRIVDISRTLIKNYKTPSIVLIDVYSTLNFYQALWAKYLASIVNLPYIVVLHGGNLPHRFKSTPVLTKSLLAHAEVIVAPSLYLKEAVTQLGYKVISIPNQLELKKYSFLKRTLVKPKLLWVRAFDTTYNPQMAIEVLIELLKTYPEASLTMVGPDKDGSMQECKELVNRYSLNDSVRFTGALTKANWHLIAQQHDLFINTTKVDNTPLSVMEAMAMGLPVVSTKVGGIPYLLEDGFDALLCESGDVKSMAKLIRQLMEDTELVHKLCLNARKKVAQFDVEIVKEQWITLLNHV